nr:MAG TPA: hypothetical protein [Caudoviricetes sp.]
MPLLSITSIRDRLAVLGLLLRSALGTVGVVLVTNCPDFLYAVILGRVERLESTKSLCQIALATEDSLVGAFTKNIIKEIKDDAALGTDCLGLGHPFVANGGVPRLYSIECSLDPIHFISIQEIKLDFRIVNFELHICSYSFLVGIELSEFRIKNAQRHIANTVQGAGEGQRIAAVTGVAGHHICYNKMPCLKFVGLIRQRAEQIYPNILKHGIRPRQVISANLIQGHDGLGGLNHVRIVRELRLIAGGVGGGTALVDVGGFLCLGIRVFVQRGKADTHEIVQVVDSQVIGYLIPHDRIGGVGLVGLLGRSYPQTFDFHAVLPCGLANYPNGLNVAALADMPHPCVGRDAGHVIRAFRQAAKGDVHRIVGEILHDEVIATHIKLEFDRSSRSNVLSDNCTHCHASNQAEAAVNAFVVVLNVPRTGSPTALSVPASARGSPPLPVLPLISADTINCRALKVFCWDCTGSNKSTRTYSNMAAVPVRWSRPTLYSAITAFSD